MHSLSENPENDLHALNKRKKSADPFHEENNSKMSDTNMEELDQNDEEPAISKQLVEWLKTFGNWSHSERIRALDYLVTSDICEVQQMRHLLSIIEPQLQRDFISLLPKELSLYVLSFLEPPVLLKAAQTCRYWRILCEDHLLWREKCREEGLLEDHENFADLFRNRLSTTSRLYSSHNHTTSANESTNESSSRASHSEDPFYSTDFKHAYLRQKSIEFNWRYGQLNYLNSEDGPITLNNNQADNSPPEDNSQQSSKNESVPLPKKLKSRKLKEILHLKGHEDHVITCLQFNATSNIIVSGSDDNSLKVWSSITGRCLRTLNGHSGGVWSSQLSADNVVISGSTDRTLRVWNALNGQCLHVLYGHTSTVRCMALNGKYVVSGSRDATLRVWNINSGTCEHVLVGHLAAVRCVQFNGNLCVSGAYDFLVKVWDVASETCLHTLEGHTNRVYSLQFDGVHIVSGSLDTSIRVWSVETGKLKHTLIGHQSLTSGMQLRGNTLVSGNADSTVKVWDINTGQCLQTLSGNNKHQSAVTCLQFNSKFVITSSDDGTVKLWDLKTGEFIRNLISLPSGGSGGVVWRIRASNTKLVCAVGSRNGTEETKLLVLDFETPSTNYEPDSKPDLSSELLNQSPSSRSGFPFDEDVLMQPEQSSIRFVECFPAYPSNPSQESSANSKELNPSQLPSDSTSTSTMSSLSSTPSSSSIAIPSISLQPITSNSSSSNFANEEIPPQSKPEFLSNGCQSLSSSPKGDQEDEETKSDHDGDDSQPMEPDF